MLGLLTPQNRLVMRVMLATGLRVGDVVALKTASLARRFSIVEQKTGKRRVVVLSDRLLADLRANAGRVWVFPGALEPEVKHRCRQAVWKDVKRAARAFRLRRNVGPHTARKIYAVELMRKYGDIEKVRKALNHDNEFVTLIYAMADKHAELRKKSSRSRKKS